MNSNQLSKSMKEVAAELKRTSQEFHKLHRNTQFDPGTVHRAMNLLETASEVVWQYEELQR